jgi:hypothetical protein
VFRYSSNQNLPNGPSTHRAVHKPRVINGGFTVVRTLKDNDNAQCTSEFQYNQDTVSEKLGRIKAASADFCCKTCSLNAKCQVRMGSLLPPSSTFQFLHVAARVGHSATRVFVG